MTIYEKNEKELIADLELLNYKSGYSDGVRAAFSEIKRKLGVCPAYHILNKMLEESTVDINKFLNSLDAKEKQNEVK